MIAPKSVRFARRNAPASDEFAGDRRRKRFSPTQVLDTDGTTLAEEHA